MERNSRLRIRLTFFSLLVLVIAACAPAPPPDDIVIPRRASPTPENVPPQATESQGQPASTPAPFAARLAVLTPGARVFKSGGGEIEVLQAQSADIQVSDGIEMIKPRGQAEQSYGILSFPDLLNVELFSGTRVFLADLKQGAEGPADITLDLDGGHLFVHLNQERPTQVTVQTPYTTIRALTAGAEFDVCRDETRTCVVVKRGVVEITARDKREIVKAGEAGVVFDDQPPSPAICVSDPALIAWEERFRLFADAPALQEEIAALPQNPCPLTADGFPLQARILYQDEFSAASSGWYQGGIDSFLARYIRSSGPRYYQIQAQGPQDQYLAFVPDGRVYEDVNVDVRVLTESAGSGDFRYGVIFRRTGNQYYAFAISPGSKTWYLLKRSSDGLEVLKEGIDQRMRGLEAQDTLRVETYGSTFLVYINGRFIDWISDSEYASGEIGLFVESIDTSNAVIGFNSITIWDIPAPALNPNQGENCFNARDDDGDGRIDQADPSCQRGELDITSPGTSPPLPTSTPRPVQTPTAPPPATQPPLPTGIPPLPTLPIPLPTLPLPTLNLPLPTIVLPLPTINLPLPTIDLPFPIQPPAGTPTPK